MARTGVLRWDGRPPPEGEAEKARVTNLTGMALFLDRHKAPGATAADIAAAHELDLAVQDKYQVRYVTYWFDDREGTVFCLAEGPDRESLETVHREAHGLVADHIIEVGDGPINAFLATSPDTPQARRTSSPLFGSFCSPTCVTRRSRLKSWATRDSWCFFASTTTIVRAALHYARWTRSEAHGRWNHGVVHVRVGCCRVRHRYSTALHHRNEGAELPIHLRVGISVGEPVTEGGDLFGAAVQLSARLCGAAAPGGIAVSTAVRDLCVGKRFGFDSKGALDLKGFAEPVPVFEVRLPAQ